MHVSKIGLALSWGVIMIDAVDTVALGSESITTANADTDGDGGEVREMSNQAGAAVGGGL